MERRLLLDVMLGKLSTYLRMCGYDAAYALDRDVEADDRLLSIARDEDRTLLTRDRELAARAPDSVVVTSTAIEAQLRELTDAGLALSLADPPSRCGRCNGRLEPVDAGERTPADVPDPDEARVWRCLACRQYFWRGSHWEDVGETLASI